MQNPSLEDQFAAGAALEFLLHFLEKWSKTPWISEHTTKITILFRTLFALAATIGISWKYSGGTLVVTGLTVSTIAAGLWHLFRQYAVQHGFGHLIRNGNLDKFQAIVQNVVTEAIKENAMKTVSTLLLCAALLFAVKPAHAQTAPQNYYAAGVSFNNSAHPAIAGTGLYARAVTDASGTYALGAVDVLPNTLKPLTVTTIFSTGGAQKVTSIGKINLYTLASAGIAYSGSSTGWGWTGGGAAAVPIGKTKWRAFPNIRFADSNTSHGSGYQLTVGCLFGRAF